MTVFWPLTMAGGGEMVVHTADGIRLVVNDNVKRVELAGPSLQRRQSEVDDNYGAASRKNCDGAERELV